VKALKYPTSAILFASLLFGCSGGDSTSGLDQSRTDITEESEALTVAEPSTEIVDEDEELFVDESDLVEQTASSFKVTTPNGGQKWTTSKSYAIKWTKGKAGATVKIQLLKSGKHYKWVSKKTKNDGKLIWKIPSSVATSSAYKIKIVSSKKKKIFDTSNKNFTISSPPTCKSSHTNWIQTKNPKSSAPTYDNLRLTPKKTKGGSYLQVTSLWYEGANFYLWKVKSWSEAQKKSLTVWVCTGLNAKWQKVGTYNFCASKYLNRKRRYYHTVLRSKHFGASRNCSWAKW